MSASPDFIQIDAADTVATALHDLDIGSTASIAGPTGGSTQVVLLDPIRLGHKVALRDIRTGDLVIKYGRPIGRATESIPGGAHVHVQNLESLSVADGLLPEVAR